ncbi:MAG TPA: FAD-dependent oxidoreductase [Planctomycetota bacterium]|nr:FAD-dependent oxidoreductase [Planctomycetota bacterium]
METKTVDYLIVGSGVIGHGLAFRLKALRPEATIAIAGDPMNSLAASRAAAGMLAPYCESEKDDRFYRFAVASLKRYPAFLQELEKTAGRVVGYSAAGSLMPECQMKERFEPQLAFLKATNVPFELWSQDQARAKLPILAADIGRVAWVPEALVNNRQMHDALQEANRKRGVTMHLGVTVTGFHRDGRRITAVATDHGDLPARQVVLATGSWSGTLADVLGLKLPLKPIKGQMCRLAAPSGKDAGGGKSATPLPYNMHGKLSYIAPWPEQGGWVVGSTQEDRGFEPAIEEDVIQGLVAKAASMVPMLKTLPIVERWTGLRPAAEDRMPVIGKSGRYENLFFSTGHFRNGILLTPMSADYLASVMLGDAVTLIPEFAPGRYDL